jgi:hypothetical protein
VSKALGDGFGADVDHLRLIAGVEVGKHDGQTVSPSLLAAIAQHRNVFYEARRKIPSLFGGAILAELRGGDPAHVM